MRLARHVGWLLVSVLFITMVSLPFGLESAWAVDGDYAGIKAVMYYDPVVRTARPFFPIGWYTYGPIGGDLSMMEEIAASGATTILYSDVMDSSDWHFGYVKMGLDKANQLGLKIVVGFSRIMLMNVDINQPESYKQFERWVKAFRDHPALLGWQLGDENGGPLTAAMVNDSARAIRQLDANHQIWQVFATQSELQSFNSHVTSYMTETDIYSLDFYQYFDTLNENPTPPFGGSAALLKWYHIGADLVSANRWAGPVNVTQAIGADRGAGIDIFRFPSYEEYRWNVFAAIASAGARGTMNWIYYYGENYYSDKAKFFEFRDKIVKPVSLEQREMAHALATGWNVGQVSSNLDEPVAEMPFHRASHLLLDDDQKQMYYLIVTNNTADRQEITLVLKDLPVPLSSVAVETKENRKVEVKVREDGIYHIHDTLENYGVRIYSIPAESNSSEWRTEVGMWGPAVLKPLEPVEQARRALTGFMSKVPIRLAGEEGYYRARFDSVLLPFPKAGDTGFGPGTERWDLGDCTGRAILAWDAVRQMTLDQVTGLEVEEGQKKLLLSMLHPETGLIWWETDEQNGVYRYHIWDQSWALRGLVCWFARKPEDRQRLRPLIERMIYKLDSLATIRGTDAVWGSYAGLPSDDFTNEVPGVNYTTHFVNNRAGICIEPIVEYAQITGDAKILDIAIRFANCELGGHEGDIVGPGEKRFFEFGANGSFVGHLHTKAGTLIGIAKLARRLAEQGREEEAIRYLRAVRKSYDWIFVNDTASHGSRIGWIPESLGGHGQETCCDTDVIELAAALASCASIAPAFADWINLYDDAEAITVNMISRLQVRMAPEFEKMLAGFYGDNAEQYLKTARQFDGVWSGGGNAPNNFIQENQGKPYLPLGGCCQYSGVSGLYAGWRDAMVYDGNTLRINYFMNRQSEHADMITAMPMEGRAAVTLRAAVDVSLRVPGWLKAEEMVIRLGDKEIKPLEYLDATRHWIILGRLAAGTKIEAQFPIEEYQTEESFPGQALTVRWRGNYVVQIRPRTVELPIFP